MGLFVVYQKSRETETEVEYHYGKSETDLNMRVVIDKASGRPKQISDSRLGLKVFSRVAAERNEIDQWPEGGAIQS